MDALIEVENSWLFPSLSKFVPAIKKWDDLILPNFQYAEKIITDTENSRKMKIAEISISRKKIKLPKKFIPPEISKLANSQIQENHKRPNFQIPENSKLMNFKNSEKKYLIVKLDFLE